MEKRPLLINNRHAYVNVCNFMLFCFFVCFVNVAAMKQLVIDQTCVLPCHSDDILLSEVNTRMKSIDRGALAHGG